MRIRIRAGQKHADPADPDLDPDPDPKPWCLLFIHFIPVKKRQHFYIYIANSSLSAFFPHELLAYIFYN